MKLATILPLVALSTAFVIPDEDLTTQIVVETKDSTTTFKDDTYNTLQDLVKFTSNSVDTAIDLATDAYDTVSKSFHACHFSWTAFDGVSWLKTRVEDLDLFSLVDENSSEPHHPPHKPHDGHHGKPNLTVYELIAGSKYTTKFAKLISEYPDLVKALNGTKVNHTVFAPTDHAFAKLPEGHKKPSKEIIEKILAYHVSPEFYPAGRVLVSHTIPTLVKEESLGGEPQRLRVSFSLVKGLSVNFYSKIVAVDIFGTNGVIHAVDSILLPPPPALKILSLLPAEFSTLDLALVKTGLGATIAKSHHTGGTFFAPSNVAFRKLGPKINAFLFSAYGEKYLKALLEYHIIANQTLYSDAFYKAKSIQYENAPEAEDVPKGKYHLDLPTLLGDRSLSIDIVRWGGFIQIKINGYTNVAVQDGLAKDGVLQVLTNVLIPPKTPKGVDYGGEEMSVEDLKERLEPYLQEEEIKGRKSWWEL